MKNKLTIGIACAVFSLSAFACAQQGPTAQPAQYPVGVDGVASAPAAAPAPLAPPSPVAPLAPTQANEDVAIGDGADADASNVGNADYADTDPSALTDFHSALDQYGTWVNDATYGTVWVPSRSAVGPDFTPYVSSGHWTYDDDSDYSWVSDYSWGWAPFHYGRWSYLNGYGWSWFPGRTYAGAWVNWRMGYGGWGYVGWAPLAPTWCWRGGVAVGIGVVPHAPYVFVSNHALFSPGIAGHVLAGAQVGVVAAHTRPFVGASMGAGIAGRTLAHPGVVGPSPAHLGLSAGEVAHTPVSHPGLAQARAFAHPTVATAHASPSARSWQTRTIGGISSERLAPTASAPRYAGAYGETHAQPSYHAVPGTRTIGASGAYARSYAGARGSYYASPRVGGYRAGSYAPHFAAPAAHHYSAPASGFHSGGGYRGGGGGHGGGHHR